MKKCYDCDADQHSLRSLTSKKHVHVEELQQQNEDHDDGAGEIQQDASMTRGAAQRSTKIEGRKSLNDNQLRNPYGHRMLP